MLVQLGNYLHTKDVHCIQCSFHSTCGYDIVCLPACQRSAKLQIYVPICSEAYFMCVEFHGVRKEKFLLSIFICSLKYLKITL